MKWLSQVLEDRDPWFITFILVLVLLSWVRQSEGLRLGIFLRSFINPSLLSQQVRQERAYNRVVIPLFFVVIVSLSLFLLHAEETFNLTLADNFTISFLLIASLLIGITLARAIIYFSIAVLFGVSNLFRLHNLQWLLHNFMLALFLLPLSILYSYGPESWRLIWIYIGLSAFVLTYVLRASRLFGLVQSEIQPPMMYNVLYFCALEILPPTLVVAGVLRIAEG